MTVQCLQNDVVQTPLNKYTVLTLLGEGGFGAVFKVRAANGLLHAMKVEATGIRRDSKLKMEVS